MKTNWLLIVGWVNTSELVWQLACVPVGRWLSSLPQFYLTSSLAVFSTL